MNEDESTQSLSDSVIGRATLLRFWRPKKTNPELAGAARIAPTNGLTFKNWEAWIRAVGLWLAEKIRRPIPGVVGVDSYWMNLQTALKTPLPLSVLLVNREGTVRALSQWASGSAGALAVRAPLRRNWWTCLRLGFTLCLPQRTILLQVIALL